MSRVAAYIRVSTTEQAKEGYSLDAQLHVIKQWCDLYGHEIKRVYADEGISAKDITHRPQIKQMLSDAKTGEFDLVAVWDLSRLSRKLADFINTFEYLRQYRVELASITQAFDSSTPVGRMMMHIISSFAEYERECTSERVRLAMAERAAKGKRTCNEVLGYDLDGPDSLRINEAEAERVRYIFDRYLAYHNLSAVAELCEQRGYRGKRGRVFRPENIKRILTRPIYAGYNSYCGQLYKGNFEPIISAAQFNRVQRCLGRPAKTGRKRIHDAPRPIKS